MIVKPEQARKRPLIGDGCTNKCRYPNRKTAAAYATKTAVHFGEQFEAYHCNYHHCWHVGHARTIDR